MAGITTSVVMSVSSDSTDCTNIITSLRQAGIMADITKNITIVPNKDPRATTPINQENGCRIVFGIPPEKNTYNVIENVWGNLSPYFFTLFAFINLVRATSSAGRSVS